MKKTIGLGPNVKLNGLKPEMSAANTIALLVFIALGYITTMTSVCDREHSRNSLHYSGNAVDYWLGYIPESQWQSVVDHIKAALAGGGEFDVILNKEQRIIHVEFQPHGWKR
jgi:hypothetical protein